MGNLDTDMRKRRTPREDQGRDWSDPCTSQGTPKIIRKPPELGERHRTDSLPQPSEETNPANTLILDV